MKLSTGLSWRTIESIKRKEKLGAPAWFQEAVLPYLMGQIQYAKPPSPQVMHDWYGPEWRKVLSGEG